MRREGGRPGFLDSAHTTAEGPTFSPTNSHSAWSGSRWSPACRGGRSPAVSEPTPSPYDVGGVKGGALSDEPVSSIRLSII